jgi:hypothetical protein
MWHVRGRREMPIGFWYENLKERAGLEDPTRTWENNIKTSLKNRMSVDWIHLAQDRDK